MQTNQRKSKLNDTIRAKIATQIILNPKNTHKEIAEFYGISRQLVTLIAKENNLERTPFKGLIGSYNYPKRTKADIQSINNRFSDIDSDKLKSLVNSKF